MKNDQPKSTRVRIGTSDVIVPNTVDMVLEVQNKWLVLFRPDFLPDSVARRNVWCFSERGELLWKIQPAPYYINLADSWVSVRIKDGDVRLMTFSNDRHIYWLDVETGRVFSSPGRPLPDEPDRE